MRRQPESQGKEDADRGREVTPDLDPRVVLKWMREHFDVFPKEGVLIWRKPTKYHPDLLDESAGSYRESRGKHYCHIKMNGLALKRGWLIFLWVNKRWPQPMLDHKNGDSSNDSIANLREATATQNAWNHKKRARRIALPMGVRNTLSGRFQARLACNKKMLHLGTFDTPEKAAKAYRAKRKELYREFA